MVVENLTAILYKKDDLRLENLPVPEPKRNEVRLKIQSVGICGSDVSYLKKGYIGDFVVRKPMVIGHEGAAVVDKCGEDVKNLRAGDRVAVEPGVPCRCCEVCKNGRYNLCQDIVFCATPPVDGLLCRYYCHAADFCYKLPDNVSLEEGALLEPLSVGVHACRRANLSLGHSILICGAGPIGLVNMLVAKSMGASKIFITDISQQRLEKAKKMGADFVQKVEVGSGNGDIVNKIKECLGKEPDITIECSGSQPAVQLACLATKPGGCVVLVGLGAPNQNIPIVHASVREVDIRGVFRYANCYPTALAMVASKRVDVKSLITHNFNLEQTIEAFDAAQKEEAIKVMIHC